MARVLLIVGGGIAAYKSLELVRLLKRAGHSVEPTSAAFQAAASGAQWASAKDFYVILTNAPGDTSWPIAGSTFILMQSSPVSEADSGAALKFFDWGYKNGKKMAADLDYVSMPDSVVTLIEKTWKEQIKGAGANF